MEAAALRASETPPVVVRIKRKRDEPPLDGFVLSSKRRPTVSSLSVNSEPLAATRYRLTGTVDRVGGGIFEPSPQSTTGISSDDPALRPRHQAHLQRVRVAQSHARYHTIALRRSCSTDGGDSSAPQQVLELQRCASVPSLATLASGAEPPVLRPFGPALPPRSSKPQSATGSNCTIQDHVDIDQIWRDAEAAARMSDMRPGHIADAASPAATAGYADDADDFVYDEYSVALDSCPGDAAWGELWWEELDQDEVDELQAMGGGADSDSQGEVDYPDDESAGSSSDDAAGWSRRDQYM